MSCLVFIKKNITNLMEWDMKNIDPMRDIAALAAYQPRQAAIQMIIDGRIDDYFVWAQDKSHFAVWGEPVDGTLSRPDETSAFPVDDELLGRIYDSTTGLRSHNRKQKRLKLWDEATKAIPYFNASPLEIALRSGCMTSLEVLLKRLTSPEKRFADGRNGVRGEGWASLLFRSKALLTDEEDNLSLVEWGCSSSNLKPLIMLACLLGNFEAAALMQRHGWAPNNEFEYADLYALLNQAGQAFTEAPELEDLVALKLDIPKGTFNQAGDWLWNCGQMASKLEDLFGEKKDYPGIREKVFALLDEGAPVGYFSLAVATEHNDLEMLRRLFDSGGDPNAVYRTGWSILAKINSKKLSAEALQIWLDRGSSPINHMDADSPYDLSALVQWAWEGRLDLIRQSVDQAAGPVPLTYERNIQLDDDDSPKVVKTFSPLLASALSKGHLELVVWLLRDKKLSLDDWDDWDGGRWEPCHTFASTTFLSEVKTALAQ
jgi:hypothetical protein